MGPVVAKSVPEFGRFFDGLGLPWLGLLGLPWLGLLGLPCLGLAWLVSQLGLSLSSLSTAKTTTAAQSAARPPKAGAGGLLILLLTMTTMTSQAQRQARPSQGKPSKPSQGKPKPIKKPAKFWNRFGYNRAHMGSIRAFIPIVGCGIFRRFLEK